MGVPRETTDLIETTAVRFRTGQKSPMLHSAGLQNPTEWRWNSPFFGSVLLRFLLVGTAVDRIGDHEVRVCDWGKTEYRYCGFLVKTIILSRCKRLRRSARICLKLPRLNPPRGSADNAAIAASLGTTG